MDFLKTLLQDVKPGDTLLDIGANIGGYTSEMRRHCPATTIYAFEPVPVMFATLYERFRGPVVDDRIILVQKGVSDHVHRKTGLAVHEAWTINRPGETARGRNATYGGPTFDVEFTTVDEVMALDAYGREKFGLHARPCAFIKIDTDGYDYRVLQGARETIRRDRPTILIEFGYCITDLGDKTLDLLRLIADLGYVVYDQAGARCGWDDWQDWYPHKTTRDYALIPAEIDLRPID